MEELFTPHFGLMLWTIITFIIMVIILGRYGWGPLIRGIESREKFLSDQRRITEEALAGSEQLWSQTEKELAENQKTIHQKLTKAHAEGMQSPAQLIAAAKW